MLRNKHIIITSKHRFDVVITCLLRTVQLYDMFSTKDRSRTNLAHKDEMSVLNFLIASEKRDHW